MDIPQEVDRSECLDKQRNEEWKLTEKVIVIEMDSSINTFGDRGDVVEWFQDYHVNAENGIFNEESKNDKGSKDDESRLFVFKSGVTKYIV